MNILIRSFFLKKLMHYFFRFFSELRYIKVRMKMKGVHVRREKNEMKVGKNKKAVGHVLGKMCR